MGSCLDINECELGLDDCAADAHCINRPGTYYCRCPIGMYGNGSYCEISYVGARVFFIGHT